MSIAVTVLGSSAMFATVERASSGYLLEFAGKRLWLDAGAGTWRNLVGRCDYAALDAVVLSHRHPDHTTDVFQAMHARVLGRTEPLDPIPLWAPAETNERLLAFSKEIDQAFDLNTVGDGGSVEFGGARMSFVKMAHPPETVGVRLEHDGTVLAYSSDSGPEADFETLARDADLFICEATFQESDELWEGHMSAAQAGTVAAEANARTLVLSHLPAARDLDVSLDEARKTFGDAVVLAADGMRLEI